jgi:crossover junction endodeoxyribonuclease RuvC
MKVIGIDPGLAATGIGIVTGRGDRVAGYAYGAIRTCQTETHSSRLEKIYSRLRTLFSEEKPELIVIEQVFSLATYPKSAITLGTVCGVVLLAGQQSNATIREIAVREAKSVLTGNGAASKAQLEKAVRQALGIQQTIHPFHASDALGLALIGLFRYGSQCRLIDGNRN